VLVVFDAGGLSGKVREQPVEGLTTSHKKGEKRQKGKTKFVNASPVQQAGKKKKGRRVSTKKKQADGEITVTKEKKKLGREEAQTRKRGITIT